MPALLTVSHWGFRGLLRIRFGCDYSFQYSIQRLNRIRTDYPAVEQYDYSGATVIGTVLLAISLLILLAINSYKLGATL